MGSVGTGRLGMPSLKRGLMPQLHKDPFLEATPASYSYLLKLGRDGVAAAASHCPPSPVIGRNVASRSCELDWRSE